MTDTLQTFTAGVRELWGPLTSELVAGCCEHLEALARASTRERWLADLRRLQPERRELYRDPDHGFMLLAHTETAGLFRPPHDHGRAWVLYGLQHGEMEIRTYARVEDPGERVRLVQRDSTILRAGEARPYLPGDIHDTRCLTDSALLFRFTERDLKLEDQVERRMTRYEDQGGVWTPAAA